MEIQLRTWRRVRTAIAAAVLSSAAVACDPGNAPVTLGERTLTPASSGFGKAHYYRASWLVDSSYDVTWIVVSDHPDVCGFFTRYAACTGEGAPADADAARLPDGIQLGLSYNSLSEDDDRIEHSTGTLLAFSEVRDAGVVFEDLAVAGQLSGRGRTGDSRVWGNYDVTTDGGLRVQGSWSAERCPAMDAILEWELYERERCSTP